MSSYQAANERSVAHLHIGDRIELAGRGGPRMQRLRHGIGARIRQVLWVAQRNHAGG